MAKKNGSKNARVYKRIDLVGVSDRGFEDAIQTALRKASQTLKGLSWFEVKDLRGSISNDGIREFQVVMTVNFEVK